MRRPPFARHLPVGKCRHRYASCRDATEKVRWHAPWLLARADVPRTPAEVADLVGLSAVTVWVWAEDQARLRYPSRNPAVVQRVVGSHRTRRLEQ